VGGKKLFEKGGKVPHRGKGKGSTREVFLLDSTRNFQTRSFERKRHARKGTQSGTVYAKPARGNEPRSGSNKVLVKEESSPGAMEKGVS